MAHYRIYLLDNFERIVSGSDAEVGDDRAAVAFAEGLHGPGVQSEIWQGMRCLRRVPIKATGPYR